MATVEGRARPFSAHPSRRRRYDNRRLTDNGSAAGARFSGFARQDSKGVTRRASDGSCLHHRPSLNASAAASVLLLLLLLLLLQLPLADYCYTALARSVLHLSRVV